ncbi:LysR substrate-binding domain-containing protein [Marinobacter sp. ATCH36]|uniref:LysR substrate-binding domain-containing protein n=1 Tax=Marinobacter sp. ATCH36 TaxID=2945106 RepID=UPI002020B6D9|nr:LysR substrate-binding domain-containing protein [Marinobacter sp. ATCH36]MCL7943656.1 LysR substrate-binding domain-containing protein [Marinobacter sp. ATCH36]
MGDSALETWMTQHGLDGQCNYRVDSMLGMQTAVRNGSEVAVLPCYLGDSDAYLKRLTNPLPELSVPLWILIHPDLRRVSRIKAFTDTMADYIRHALNRTTQT